MFIKKINKRGNLNNALNINRSRDKNHGYINKSKISKNNINNIINNYKIRQKNNIKSLLLKNPSKNNIKNFSLNNPRKNNIKSLPLRNQRKNNIKKPLQESKNKLINNSRNKSNINLKTKTTSIINKSKKKSKIPNYNDTEMNDLCFKEAIIKDHRTFCLYYLSLIKCKHILISTFCYFNDYNAQIIKIYLFFFILEAN